MTDTHVNRSGISFLGLLCIVFVIFKILGNITWSWWWVFCPIWIPVATIIAILVIIAVISLIIAALDR